MIALFVLVLHTALAVDFDPLSFMDYNFTSPLGQDWTFPPTSSSDGHHSYRGGNMVITGFTSTFDNGHNDRQWQFTTSRVEDLDCLAGSSSGHLNDEEENFDFTCAEGWALATIDSKRIGAKDRSFAFQCCQISETTGVHEVKYRIESVWESAWLNWYEQPVEAQCNRNEVMVGVKTQHLDAKDDRRWAIKCGLVVEVETREGAKKTLKTSERYLLGDQDTCFHHGVYWYQPGVGQGQELGLLQTESAAECQVKCADTAGCARWSWKHTYKGCYLTDANAVPELHSEYYSGYKHGCYRADLCPWEPTTFDDASGFDNLPRSSMRNGYYVCKDGSMCQDDTSSSCCDGRGNVMLCPMESPWMCKDGHCATSRDGCNSHGGLRGCGFEDTRARECPSVTVRDIHDNGKYFYFNLDEWTQMTGDEWKAAWSGSVNVHQIVHYGRNGAWRGTAVGSNNWSKYKLGRRYEDAEAGQWETGDIIVSKSCQDRCQYGSECVDKHWLENTDCTTSNPCPACRGDCSRDDDCEGDLRCYFRSDDEDVPGCRGGANGSMDVSNGRDYCYDPNLVNSMHAAANKFEEDFNFEQTNGSPVVVDVGVNYQWDNGVELVDAGVGGLICPSTVDASNWVGTHTGSEKFSVTVTDGKMVTVTRTDGSSTYWSMNLRIPCYEQNTHAVITGMRSTYHTAFDDRRYLFYTTTVPGLKCDPLGWTASYGDGDTLDFKCPQYHVLAGVSSTFNTKNDDREFSFRCCDVRDSNIGLTIKYGEERSTGFVSYEERNDVKAVDLQCAANEVAIGAYSTYDEGDHPDDRDWSLYCAVLMNDYDDCVTIEISHITPHYDQITYSETTTKEVSQLTLTQSFDFCGEHWVPENVQTGFEVTESVEKSETLELEKTFDQHYSLSTTAHWQVTVGASVDMAFTTDLGASASKEINYGLSLTAEAGWDIGTRELTSTTEGTVDETAILHSSNWEPLPFQNWVIKGTYLSETATVPATLTTTCMRSDNVERIVDVESVILIEGTSQITLTVEDHTAYCPQQYYSECACVPNLESDFVGTGCQMHPKFKSYQGCYVYKDNEDPNAPDCSNGQALSTAQPPISGGDDTSWDYGVDSIMFGWSYKPCGGDQFYPGDPFYDGIEWYDFTIKVENKACVSRNGGGTFGSTKYDSLIEAIQACDMFNLQVPDSCLGVYDAACNNQWRQFSLCSVADGLTDSTDACVYKMHDTAPETELSVSRYGVESASLESSIQALAVGNQQECVLDCDACGYNWYEDNYNDGDPTEYYNEKCNCCGGSQQQQNVCKFECAGDPAFGTARRLDTSRQTSRRRAYTGLTGRLEKLQAMNK